MRERGRERERERGREVSCRNRENPAFLRGSMKISGVSVYDTPLILWRVIQTRHNFVACLTAGHNIVVCQIGTPQFCGASCGHATIFVACQSDAPQYCGVLIPTRH
jgi:hypothetical protein